MNETGPKRAFGFKLCVGGLSVYLLALVVNLVFYQVFARLFIAAIYGDGSTSLALEIFETASTLTFFGALLATSTGAWIAARPEHPRGSNLARIAGLSLLITGALPLSLRILAGLTGQPLGSSESLISPELAEAVYLVVRVTGAGGFALLMAAVDTLHRGQARPNAVIAVGVGATIGFWLTWLGFDALDLLSGSLNSVLITAIILASDLALGLAVGIIIFGGLLPALQGATSEPAPIYGEQTSARSGPWSGVGNIVVGGLFIAGGASGTLVLRGTDSSGAIAALGGLLILVGLVRLAINHRPR